MQSVDTNILLRYLLVDNERQYPKVRTLIESSLVLRVSLLCVAEIVFIMQGKGFPRSAIKQNIESLSSLTNLEMSRAIILPALELYESHAGISFIDACLAYEAMAEHAEPLWTFDKKLANQAPSAKLVA